MRIFLSGMMGAGKSTVAKAVAARAALPLFDLDEVIAERAGCSVAEFFTLRGQEAFRELERSTLDGLLNDHEQGVFALGGGAVVARDLRRRLLAAGTLVTLEASTDELARRVGHGGGRPLLAGSDVRARLSGLAADRAEAYAECHGRLDTTHLDPERAARAILELSEEDPIVVPLGLRTYRVFVGHKTRHSLAARLRELGAVSSVLLITDTQVGPHWGRALVSELRSQGHAVTQLELAPGESAKNLETVDAIWSTALDAGLDRGSVVVGLGGGVVGDLAGFAASTLLRGVRVVHVPTTLLAMVDSAIGGKTGFDTRHGKNLIGTFHQPSLVLSDVQVLSSLPVDERRAGLAEVVKSAWIDSEASVAQLEADADALAAGDEAATVRAIRMAARLKVRIVTEDEREDGVRALLNLGHTLAHAIEASSGYAGIRHGEAVSIGMVAAARIAKGLDMLADADVQRIQGLLDRLGLPTAVEPYLSDRVLSFLTADKKRKGGKINYIVPGQPGEVVAMSMSLSDVTDRLRRC